MTGDRPSRERSETGLLSAVPMSERRSMGGKIRTCYCVVCGRRFRAGSLTLKCRQCLDDRKYVLVHDPSETFPSKCQFSCSEFRATLRDGLWPPASVWRYGGRLYIIRGNETVADPEAEYLPQLLEAVEQIDMVSKGSSQGSAGHGWARRG